MDSRQRRSVPGKSGEPSEKSELICTDGSKFEEGENPKEACGRLKVSHSCVSQAVMAEVAVGMMEGARKYGRHNYRETKITASIYYDAARRHLDAWWEGEDIDPDTGLHHITKALSCLSVLRDGQIQGKTHDDRPPKIPDGFWKQIQNRVDEVLERLPECKEPITEISSLVERLKNNLKPFCLMPEEMQAKAKEIGIDSFEWFSYDGKVMAHWNNAESFETGMTTYRLRANYTESQEEL